MTGIAPADVDFYLAKRAEQQFNVIQFHCGRLVKDYAGRLPFRSNDALAPDEEYWRNVDSIVTKAGDRGIYIALVPLWGEEYGRLFGTDAEKAGQFGRWIGARYAARTNVVWIASGEHDSINGFRLPISAAQKAVLTAAARGIREATSGRQLITVHPGARAPRPATSTASPGWTSTCCSRAIRWIPQPTGWRRITRSSPTTTA